MKKFSVLIISIFCVSAISWQANAEGIEVTTDEGKQVLLNDDGTWQYILKAKTDDGRELLLNNDGTWQYIGIWGKISKFDQEFLSVLKANLDKWDQSAWEESGECLTEQIDSYPIVVKESFIDLKINPNDEAVWEYLEKHAPETLVYTDELFRRCGIL